MAKVSNKNRNSLVSITKFNNISTRMYIINNQQYCKDITFRKNIFKFKKFEQEWKIFLVVQ